MLVSLLSDHNLLILNQKNNCIHVHVLVGYSRYSWKSKVRNVSYMAVISNSDYRASAHRYMSLVYIYWIC